MHHHCGLLPNKRVSLVVLVSGQHDYSLSKNRIRELLPVQLSAHVFNFGSSSRKISFFQNYELLAPTIAALSCKFSLLLAKSFVNLFFVKNEKLK